MNTEINKTFLTDTGFWRGLYKKDDKHHTKSIKIMNKIQNTTIIIPWPIYYEFLNTKFVKNKVWITEFDKTLKTLNIEQLDDTSYREKALQEVIRLSSVGKRNISMVDMVLRFVLEDKMLKIDYLVTYNERDFIDVCKRSKIPIYYA